MEAELAVKEIATIYRRIAKKYEENESSALVSNQREVVSKEFTSSVIEQAVRSLKWRGRMDLAGIGLKMWDEKKIRKRFRRRYSVVRQEKTRFTMEKNVGPYAIWVSEIIQQTGWIQ